MVPLLMRTRKNRQISPDTSQSDDAAADSFEFGDRHDGQARPIYTGVAEDQVLARIPEDRGRPPC
jgi:hypothetical protein